MTPTRRSYRKGLKFALQRTQGALARENYLRPSKTDSGPFLDALSPLNKNKGGADAAGSGGQRPQRGSIRRAEGSDIRGSVRLPAGGCLPGAVGGNGDFLMKRDLQRKDMVVVK